MFIQQQYSTINYLYLSSTYQNNHLVELLPFFVQKYGTKGIQNIGQAIVYFTSLHQSLMEEMGQKMDGEEDGHFAISH